jgi:hypothetical protein
MIIDQVGDGNFKLIPPLHVATRFNLPGVDQPLYGRAAGVYSLLPECRCPSLCAAALQRSLFGSATHSQLACGLVISEELLHPTNLPFGVFGVCLPGDNRCRQFLDPSPLVDLNQQPVAACEQLVDGGIISATPINVQDGSLAEARIEIQNGFGLCNQLWQAAIELCFTGILTISSYKVA